MLTGARYGELCALLVGDFDRGRKALRVRGGKTGACTIPLSDAAAALLVRLCRTKTPAAHVFFATTAGRGSTRTRMN